jgi:putative membrane protein
MAWIRTAVALIGLGFLVARFGTFLRMVAGQATGNHHRFSLIIGVGLVLLGSLVMAVTALQHRQFVKGIRSADLPNGYSTSFSIWIAMGLSGIGLLLTAYLVLSARDLDVVSAIAQ